MDDFDARISFAREHSTVDFLTSLVRLVIMRVTRALSLVLTPRGSGTIDKQNPCPHNGREPSSTASSRLQSVCKPPRSRLQ